MRKSGLRGRHVSPPANKSILSAPCLLKVLCDQNRAMSLTTGVSVRTHTQLHAHQTQKDRRSPVASRACKGASIRSTPCRPADQDDAVGGWTDASRLEWQGSRWFPVANAIACTPFCGACGAMSVYRAHFTLGASFSFPVHLLWSLGICEKRASGICDGGGPPARFGCLCHFFARQARLEGEKKRGKHETMQDRRAFPLAEPSRQRLYHTPFCWPWPGFCGTTLANVEMAAHRPAFSQWRPARHAQRHLTYAGIW